MKIDLQLSYIGQLEKKASKVSSTWEKMIEGTLCLVFFICLVIGMTLQLN